MRTLTGAAIVAAVLMLAPAGASALDESLDPDGDGWYSELETALGSDGTDADATPETFAIEETCDDGADNDGDGATDRDDDGCTVPPVITTGFPPAGEDVFSTRMELRDFALQTPLGLCRVTFDGAGPAVIDRSGPSADPAPTVDLVIEAMQLDGFAVLLPNSPCNRTPSFRRFPATVVESPTDTSTGLITALSADADFPADSFFDIFFSVDTPQGVLAGGPEGGEPGGALRVTNEIRSLPPFFSPRAGLNPTCYSVPGQSHQHCPTGPLDHLLCYSGEPPRVEERPIRVSDHVAGEQEANTTQILRLCNPAVKGDARIADPGGHFTMYGLNPSDPPGTGTLGMVNQFDEFELPHQPASELMVPTRKDDEPDPMTQDHFVCYGFGRVDFSREVTVADQWIAETIAVGRPELGCVVAEKTRDGESTAPSDPGRSYLCFDVRLPVDPETVLITNQFDQLRATFDTLELLCVPSLRPFEVNGGPTGVHATDRTAPTVTLHRLGTDDEGRTVLRFDVQDTGSGLDRVHVRAPLEGVEVVRQPFTPPTKQVVSVTIRKDPGVRASVEVWGVDWTGLFKRGDPVWVEVLGGRTEHVGDVPSVERTVTVTNGVPGLTALTIRYRDHPPRTLALRPGQQVTTSFPAAGDDPIDYRVAGAGPGQATVMIWDGIGLRPQRPGATGRPGAR